MPRRVLIALAIVLIIAPPLVAMACLDCSGGPCTEVLALPVADVAAEKATDEALPPCHQAMAMSGASETATTADHNETGERAPRMASDCCLDAATLPAEASSPQPTTATSDCDPLEASASAWDLPRADEGFEDTHRPPPLASSALYTLHSTLLI